MSFTFANRYIRLKKSPKYADVISILLVVLNKNKGLLLLLWRGSSEPKFLEK